MSLSDEISLSIFEATFSCYFHFISCCLLERTTMSDLNIREETPKGVAILVMSVLIHDSLGVQG